MTYTPSSAAGAAGAAAAVGDDAPRVRFLCSFGGTILPRPLDSRLRYVGGQTRIVSVPRHASFADILACLRLLFDSPTPLAIKYQQPNKDLDALVSVINHDDVLNLMDEYDKLAADASARLRIFLFSSHDPIPFTADDRETERRYIDALNDASSPPSPDFHRFWSPAAAVGDDALRVKFLCSFGGTILPRPLDSRLRYVGGVTRIVSVPRHASFADILARLRLLFDSPTPFTIKYQQPDKDLDALVSVVNHDDVLNLMDEYDKLGANASTRLRIFLFSSHDPIPFAADDRETERRYIDALNDASSPPSPDFHRLWSPAAAVGDDAPRLRFRCGFGRTILPRPLDSCLCYVGGETRIVSVPLHTSFTDILARLRLLFVNHDDVLNLMDEYDKLGAGAFTCLRILLFSSHEPIPFAADDRHIDALNDEVDNDTAEDVLQDRVNMLKREKSRRRWWWF